MLHPSITGRAAAFGLVADIDSAGFLCLRQPDGALVARAGDCWETCFARMAAQLPSAHAAPSVPDPEPMAAPAPGCLF